MKSLTVRQPWASAIFELGKDVENRSRPTKHRGTLAIHAGVAWDHDGSFAIERKGFRVPIGAIGAIIGLVDVLESHPSSQCLTDTLYGGEAFCSTWAMPGLHHWVLSNPRAIEPIPCRGALGLWTVPDDLAAQIEVTP